MSRKAVCLTAILLLALWIPFVWAADDRGVLEGVVKDSSGKALAGAFVKLKNAERRLTFMVISQDQGRYRANELPAGNYSVQGVGAGLQSNWSAPVNVVAGKAAKFDLSLTVKQGAALPPAWPHRIPEDVADQLALTPPEGKGKELVLARCASCHDISEALKARLDRKSWQRMVDIMRGFVKTERLRDWTDEEHRIMADYLATNFPALPPPDPNGRLPRTLLEGKARKYRVVQYDLENTEAQPHDVGADPWGHGWINQRTTGKMSHFDPFTLQHTELAPPLTTAKQASVGAPIVDSHGVLWFPEGAERRWMSYAIKTQKWNSYPYPEGGAGAYSYAAPNGLIWIAAQGAALSLNPKTGEWKRYPGPSVNQRPGGYGVSLGGDGSVWVALPRADKMLKADPETGKVEEFAIPVQGQAYPRKMTTDLDGNVWVGLWRAGKLLRINPRTNQMTTFDAPGKNNGAYSPAVDKNNNIWVTLQMKDVIARFNPRTQEWTEFPLPQSESDVRKIVVDPSNSNRIWWATTGGTTQGQTGSNDFVGGARFGFLDVLE